MPVPDDVKLTYSLKISRDRIRRALEWLFKHNRLYRALHETGKLFISEDNLKQYAAGDGAVPDPIIKSAVLQTVPVSDLAHDSSSYTRHDHAQSVGDERVDQKGESWSHTGVLDTNALGLEPDALQKFVDLRDDRQSGTPTLMQEAPPAVIRDIGPNRNRILIMPAGSRVFMLDRSHPEIDHGAFPILFPYGVGGPTHPRKLRLGATRYTKHLMWLADRRFSMHPPFAFTMFNCIQRQSVCWGAGRSLRAGYFVDFAKEMEKLSPTAISDVIKDLRAAQQRGENVNLRNCSGENARTGRMLTRLFHQMTTLGGTNLPRTHSSKKTSRAELFGMYIKFGLPDLFVTVNPEDRHSVLVVHFHGRNSLALSLDDPDLPGDIPAALQRFQIVSNDPLAAAQFSAHTMDSFISALLGFMRDKPGEKLGVLGDVKCYHFDDEEQLRGSLHYHGLVWLDHKPEYDVFADLLQEDDFKSRVLTYLSSIIKNEPPVLFEPSNLASQCGLPDNLSVTSEICGLADCKGARHPFTAGTAAECTPESRATDRHISLKRVGNPDSPNFVEDHAQDLNLLVHQCMQHAHTQCCYKDKRNQGLPAEKRECRFKAPWALRNVPCIEDGQIHLRRQHHWVNSYNETFLACIRANHDIKSLWGTGTKHMAMIMYVTNYVTKLNHKLLNQLVLTEMAVDQFQKWQDKTKPAEQQAKSLLIKIYNHLQRDVELSLQTVVHTLAGFQERYLSHTPVSLCTPPFLSLIEQDDELRHHVEVSIQQSDSRHAGASESFRAVPISENESVAVNLRMDYQLRPDGLDECCLYDYVCCWQKTKRCMQASMEMTDEEKTENGIEHETSGSDGADIFQFRDPHPQRDAWGVRFRPNHGNYFVLLRGPVIRSRDRDAARFARQILLLFKPWRTVSELRKDGQKWTESFAEFEQAASARIRNYITNFETIDVHRAAWEEDVDKKDAARQAERNELNVDEDGERWWDDGKEDDPEFADELNDGKVDDSEPPEKRELNLMPFSSHDHDNQQQALYDAALRTTIFDTHSRLCVPLSQSELASSDLLRNSNLWFSHATDDDKLNVQKSLKKSLETLANDVDSAPQDSCNPDKDRLNQRDANIASANRELQAPHPSVIADVEDVSPLGISRKFQLNEKQYVAFRLIADRLMSELEADGGDPISAKRPEQLRLFIGGPGGTGKSLVIKAVQELFEKQGRRQWLQTCGPTGTSAFNVMGSTLFTLFGIQWAAKSASETIEDSVDRKQTTRNKVAQKLAQTRFLIIDEISMVGASTFARIDESLKVAKGGSADGAWAGIHVICVGDYCQLKPIGKASLFSAGTANPGTYKSRKNKELSLASRTGRELFTEFDSVIFLDEQMRQRDDPAFGQLLDRLRVGKSTCCCRHGLDLSKRGVARGAVRKEAPVTCRWQRTTLDEFDIPKVVGQCDYHTLASRCLHEASDEAQDERWKSARLITHSNPVSAAWNRDRAVDLASRTAQPILIAVAHDSVPKCDAPLTVKQKRRLFRLPDGSTGSRLGALALVVGMRVILRENLATKLGLVNGAEGTVVKVGLDPDEQLPKGLFDVRPGQFPPTYHLRLLPKYVIVHFDHLELPKALPGCSTCSEVMITPLKKSFTFEGFGPKRSITRNQLPLTPCQSMTVPMMQGRTAGDMICDLNVDDSRGHKLTLLYVMLSRAQATDRLRLLRPFHHKEMHRDRDSGIAKDEGRLRYLEQETLRKFAIRFPTSEYRPPPKPCAEQELNLTGTRVKCRHGRTCFLCHKNPATARKPSPSTIPPDQDVDAVVDFTFGLVGTQLKRGLASSTCQQEAPLASRVTRLKRKQPDREAAGARSVAKRPRNDNGLPAISERSESWCHAHLRLSERHRTDLVGMNLLDDDIVQVFQQLLREAFPRVRGWQAPAAIAVHKLDASNRISGPSIQIHNNLRSHWLASSRTRAGVYVADSLLAAEPPSPTIVRQLIQIYGDGKPHSHLDVTFLPCQTQRGSSQCGDFSIFNAMLFATCIEDDRALLESRFASSHFDQASMRSHLLDCVRAGKLLNPIVLESAPTTSISRPTTYRIHCDSERVAPLNLQ